MVCLDVQPQGKVRLRIVNCSTIVPGIGLRFVTIASEVPSRKLRRQKRHTISACFIALKPFSAVSAPFGHRIFSASFAPSAQFLLFLAKCRVIRDRKCMNA
ncbi:hypothetical protein L596_004413 [Steinernema carpocapsae]|uniref:Uncharacterized protein n=1 Tax=Steinernema carpocapsae TaxID=34508 RepID=A0A4V6I8C4_STECR|nr:hypothetical protein L596_004413 [Steinernema carpocapsae]